MSHERAVRERASGVASQARRARAVALLPGLALAVAVAVAATFVGRLVPVIGGPVSGIVLGVALAARIAPRVRLRPGIAVASTTVLQASVVALGAQLSLGQVARVGLASLPVMVGTLAAVLASAFWVGRWLGVSRNLRTLIGVGTGICGASAIAAVTPVIGAASAEVAYAVSTIFVFNVGAVLIFPALGHLLGMSEQAFGLFAGTAVNDMSSVVATATTYGPVAATYAVVIKLTRTLFIIPISLGLAALTARRERRSEATALADLPRVRIAGLVPRFLIGFLVVAAANTAGLIPDGWHPALSQASGFGITVALAAIGLSTDLGALRRAGHRPLVLGAVLWIVVCLTSLGLQHVTGTL
ncbi:YeiH family protein [Pengzhenrongella frigida]|uniref:Putative sulfate exporter family transporter n=1 Tax=Pengzhenrongella frigida TaxID=1259133 RepID=A0A4Q5N2M9_9MICO|nr:putative sulfate exporter family transporter [Cellulomonas sp. HLT2-17]RYV52326.1 putative sulfate exporter family transporter [Cellulomonas sp. HLT2-17]